MSTMISDSHHEHLQDGGLGTALKLTEDELARERLSLAELEQRRRASRSRITELERAVDHLRQVLGVTPKKVVEESTLSDGPINAILKKLASKPGGAFKAEEVQRFLDEKGFELSSRYAANTLKRLYESGKLERVGRGHYRLNNLHIGFLDLDQGDLED